MSKTTIYDPIAISKKLNRSEDHFVIYPTSGGYRFTFFSRIEKTDPFEILAVSHKAYKLKSEAIRSMKRLRYSFGSSALFSEYLFAFDHKGNKISLKIDYNIKMLL